ncbi:unnamed protein product [Fusarium graminearum]|uniref:Uncharacterized protein n=1 Tax=Gibberella zeae TaxID=5518 RepID=A0A4E9EE62_GIBZA|nr:unnamed protein product [Fusarium graminearum]CAF3463232.1 unnamed protein product [Fusarium graminearum]CAF3611852.1 unnamed protein product [Fusarium graminearum]CAG1960853.1 unnamed protein product [Fusarium graminearum]CAG1971937.1 unnamed protein product [Fusarium graminearum]
METHSMRRGGVLGYLKDARGGESMAGRFMVGQEIGMGKKGCPLKEAVRDKNGVVGVMSGVYDVVLGGGHSGGLVFGLKGGHCIAM